MPRTLRVESLPRVAFALTLVVLGLIGLTRGDFGPIWQPAPAILPARAALAYLGAIVCLACGAGLLWPKYSPRAACVLLGALLLWMLLFRLPAIFRAPGAAVSYEGWGEGAVMVAAAWILVGRAERVARIFYGLALVAFGVAHLAYVRDTAALVPAWLPAHAGWVYLTAVTYLAAGVAVLAGVRASLAAALAALQMAAFTLLVWVPIVIRGHADAGQWSELLDSWALTTSAWVVAASYRAAQPLRAR